MLRYILVFLLFVAGTLHAQDDFYQTDHVPEIKITFSESNWDELLDAMFIDGQGDRLTCDVEIDGTLIANAGIRYKGFSSASVDRTKNPFNIKLDYTSNESYQGIDKIKLSNVIQDPSFLREVMSYEIARNYMPAPRANFAKVYVNDVYWGLYTNVEAINKDFISDHFNSSDGSLFKGNPEDLDLFGENANLSDSPGELEADYYDLYKLESDIGWTDLLDLINTLNEDPENVEAILNVDRALWMHAFNYSLINYDSYVGYAQNYYIYQDINNQFNPLLWDLNMSFGSFRLTDDSDYFDGFSIEQAKVSDPLAHLNSFSVFDRPLMRELFNNSTFKRMYLAHMRTIMEQNIASNWLEDQGLLYQEIIAPHVLADTNKFYSYEDFENNLYSTVTDLTTYPGLTDLMNDRWDYLADYPGITNSPNIINVVPNSTAPTAGLTILFSAEIENTDEAWLYHRVSGSGTFSHLAMLDDGQNGDEFANDGIFSVEVTSESNAIDYYVYTQNEAAGKFFPEEAAYKFEFIGTPIDAGDLVINELMSSNSTSASDNSGDFDDWIELYNATDNSISTAGLYLSDDFENPEKWNLPVTEIPANSYFIVWADEESEQGSIHSNFQLSSLGEQLILSYTNGVVLDSLTFGPLATDQSLARFPNGTGPFVEMNTTFNAVNEPVSVQELNSFAFAMYPNPTSDLVNFQFDNTAVRNVLVFSQDGRLLMNKQSTEQLFTLDIQQLPQGIYHIQIQQGEQIAHSKICKL